MKFETGAYSVFPANAKDQPRWRAIASLALTSADFGAALALAGELQEADAFMSASRSRCARDGRRGQGRAPAAALASLRRRADAVAKDLGAAVDHFRTVESAMPATPRSCRARS